MEEKGKRKRPSQSLIGMMMEDERTKLMSHEPIFYNF